MVELYLGETLVSEGSTPSTNLLPGSNIKVQTVSSIGSKDVTFSEDRKIVTVTNLSSCSTSAPYNYTIGSYIGTFISAVDTNTEILIETSTPTRYTYNEFDYPYMAVGHMDSSNNFTPYLITGLRKYSRSGASGTGFYILYCDESGKCQGYKYSSASGKYYSSATTTNYKHQLVLSRDGTTFQASWALIGETTHSTGLQTFTLAYNKLNYVMFLSGREAVSYNTDSMKITNSKGEVIAKFDESSTINIIDTNESIPTTEVLDSSLTTINTEIQNIKDTKQNILSINSPIGLNKSEPNYTLPDGLMIDPTTKELTTVTTSNTGTVTFTPTGLLKDISILNDNWIIELQAYITGEIQNSDIFFVMGEDNNAVGRIWTGQARWCAGLSGDTTRSGMAETISTLQIIHTAGQQSLTYKFSAPGYSTLTTVNTSTSQYIIDQKISKMHFFFITYPKLHVLLKTFKYSIDEGLTYYPLYTEDSSDLSIKISDNLQITQDGKLDISNNYLTPINNKLGGLSFVKITQAEYTALTTKDENTVYFII